MSRRVRVFLALALLALLAGCEMKKEEGGAAGRKGGFGAGKTESRGDERIPVRAEAARRESMGQSLEASGPLEADRLVEVHADVAGRVADLRFEPGQRVGAGAILLVLEDPDLVRQRAQIEVSLEQKRTAHEKARVRLREIESEIESARIDLDELAKREVFLTAQAARDAEVLADKTRLWERKLVSRTEFDAAQKAVETSRNDLETTRFERRRKELAIQDLEGLEKDRAGLEVEAARLELRVEEIKKAELDADLEKMTIRAPAAGVVTTSAVEEGKWVTKETALAVLALLDPLVIRLRLPERDIPLLARDQPVRITSPTLDAMRVEVAGRVDRVSGVVDAASGTVECRVLVLGSHEALRPGMLVRCRIEVFQTDSAIVIPKRAVVWDGGDSYVFRVDDGKASRIAVELGHGRDNDVEVKKGIEAGDRIVTVGNKTLKDGTAVVVMEEE